MIQLFYLIIIAVFNNYSMLSDKHSSFQNYKNEPFYSSTDSFPDTNINVNKKSKGCLKKFFQKLFKSHKSKDKEVCKSLDPMTKDDYKYILKDFVFP